MSTSKRKIAYRTVSDFDDDFMERFSSDWSEEQFDLFTSGFRAAPETVLDALPSGADVDPRSDPVTAMRVLETPRSRLEIGEEPFLLPLLELLEESGASAAPEIRVLSQQKDFYLVKYSVDFFPEDKESFKRIDLKLDFPGGRGILTHSLLPSTLIEDRARASTSCTIGVDGGLSFAIPPISAPEVSARAASEASVSGEFLYQMEYRLIRASIVATGRNSSHAQWSVRIPESLVGNVEFAAIVAVSKGERELSMDVGGRYCLERGIWWWRRETQVEFASDEPIVVGLGE